MDYHKSSRGMPPVGMQPHGGHKMSTSSKPQQQPPPLLDSRGNSNTSSSASNASAAAKDVSKSSSSSSNSSSKMYPNAPPSYGSSGPSSNPLMSRGGYPAPPAGYGSHGSHRNKSVSSSSSSSSVHSMPPYEQQLPYGQSQAVPNYNHMQPQSQPQPPLESQQLSKNNSLFSPEWSDIKKEPQFNGLLPPPPGPAHESLGYKLNNHARDRDSPKKDRLTPTKKDKHRNTLPHGGANSGSTSSSSSSSSTKPMLPPHKKSHSDLLTNDSSRDIGSLKRANEISGSQYGLNKLDDHDTGSMPRDKVRKLDNSIGLPGYSSYSEENKHAPLSMSNGGIETTPDLVRTLLKESLCTTNGSLLKPDALTMPGLKPPAELLEPMPPTTQLHMKKESLSAPTNLLTNSLSAAPAMELDALTKLGDGKDVEGAGKSEKKKKKDKHKHKEKDKSKDKPDKEERKKHKKDKQKERSSKDTSMDSLKLVIKTAANPNGSLQVGAAAPLKLKISKNKVEPNNYSTGAGLLPMSTASGFGIAPPVQGITTTAGLPGQQLGIPGYGGYSSSNSTNSSSSSGGGGNTSKKKHSDRDRDKESKKSKTQDYAKYNGVSGGSGGGVYAPLGGAGAASNTQAAVASLLGLPPNLTSASSNANLGSNSGGSATSMVMPPTGVPAGIAPTALPIYNKK